METRKACKGRLRSIAGLTACCLKDISIRALAKTDGRDDFRIVIAFYPSCTDFVKKTLAATLAGDYYHWRGR